MIPFSIGWEAGAPPLLDRDPADHVWVEIAIERILARSIEGELETAACREDRRLELAIWLAARPTVDVVRSRRFICPGHLRADANDDITVLAALYHPAPVASTLRGIVDCRDADVRLAR